MAFQDRIELRKKAYKKASDAEDVRRKREDETVQLRKQKRDEQMSKKRAMQEDTENSAPAVSNNMHDTGMKQLVQYLAAGGEHALPMLAEIRKRLAKWSDPPVQEAIDCGVVPVAARYLAGDDEQLQFEAAWVLTNIASGTSDQTTAVVESGAVPSFVKLLSVPKMEMREQALWCLANIAGDSTKNRDGVLTYDPITPILQLIVDSENNQKVQMLRNAVWALGNMCRGKPSPDMEQFRPALPYLGVLVGHSDREVVMDTLWALSYLCDGANDRVQAVIDCNAMTTVVEQHLGSDNSKILQPALRLTGNVATGSDEQTTYLLQQGVLARMHKLLGASKSVIRKEALWLISNITAGTPEQIQMVIDESLLPRCVNLATQGDSQVRKEALYVITNAARGTPAQVDHLRELRAVQALVESLDTMHDNGIVLEILGALKIFLTQGQRHIDEGATHNIYCALIEEAGGLEKLENLQSDANETVYTTAGKLLSEFFDLETEDVEDEAPAATTFDFGCA